MDARSLQSDPRREAPPRKRAWAAKLVRAWEPHVFGVGEDVPFDFSTGGAESDADYEERARATSFTRADFFPDYGVPTLTPPVGTTELDTPPQAFQPPTRDPQEEIAPKTPTLPRYQPPSAAVRQAISPAPAPTAIPGADLAPKPDDPFGVPYTPPVDIYDPLDARQPYKAPPPIVRAASHVGHALLDTAQSALDTGGGSLTALNPATAIPQGVTRGPGLYLNDLAEGLRTGWGLTSASMEMSSAATGTAVDAALSPFPDNGVLKGHANLTVGQENIALPTGDRLPGSIQLPSLRDVLVATMDPSNAVVGPLLGVGLAGAGRVASPFVATVLPALAYGRVVRPILHRMLGSAQELAPLTRPLQSALVNVASRVPTDRLAGAVGGAGAGSLLDPEHPEEGAVLGATAGFAGMFGLQRMSKALQAAANPRVPLEVSGPGWENALPGAAKLKQMVEDAAALRAGFVTARNVPPMYVGGEFKQWFDDTVRHQWFSDRYATIQTGTDYLARKYQEATGQMLPEGADLYKFIRNNALSVHSQVEEMERQVIMPAFKEQGLEGKNYQDVMDFNLYANAKMILNRASDGIPTGTIKDVGEALQAYHATIADLANRRGDPHVVQRMDKFMDFITEVGNGSLRTMEDVGILPTGVADRIITKQGQWMALDQPEVNPALATAAKDVQRQAVVPTNDVGPGFEHVEESIADFSLPSVLATLYDRQIAIVRQRAFNTMLEAKDAAVRAGLQDSGLNILTREELQARAGYAFSEKMIPKGWKAITGKWPGDDVIPESSWAQSLASPGLPEGYRQPALPPGKDAARRVLDPDEITGLHMAKSGDFVRSEVPEPYDPGPPVRPQKGEDFTVYVPDFMADVLLGTDNKLLELTIPALNSISQWSRHGMTTFSPSFVFNNPVRDSQESFQNIGLPGGFIENVRQTVSTLAALLTSGDYPKVTQFGPSLVGGAVGALTPEMQGRGGEATWQERAGGAVAGALAAPTLTHGVGPDLKKLLGDTDIWKRAAATADRWLDLSATKDATTEALLRGVRSSSTAYSGRLAAQQRLESLTGSTSPLDQLVGVITTPSELLREMNEISEVATKVKNYILIGKTGGTPTEQLYTGRGATVDFDKGGDVMKALSQWFPLLNARKEGFLRSARAFDEDPVGYTQRTVLPVLGATVATWAWNRIYSSHRNLYDEIPDSDRQNYWNIIYSSYTSGPLGEEKPLYFRIPKNDISGIVGSAVEDMLDGIYHTKDARGQPLTPEQRTERSPWDHLKARLENVLPWHASEGFSNEVFNLAAGFLDTSPQIKGLAELVTGRNMDTGRPIIPPVQKKMVTDLQVGDVYHPASSAIASWINHLGGKYLQVPPAGVTRFVQDVGAKAGTTVLDAADVITQALGLDQVSPLDQRKRQAKPPGVSWFDWAQYLDKVDRGNNRPFIARLLPFIGAAGGQQTIGAKLAALSPEERQAYEDTHAYYNELSRIRDEVFKPKEDALFSARSTQNHREIASKAFNLWAEKRGATEALRQQFPNALTDPAARKAFIAALPGVPLRGEDIAAAADLPSNLSPETIRQRYYQPKPPEEMTQMPPQMQEQARQFELLKMAKEYDVPASVLRDVIKLSEPGKSVPALNIPQTYLNDAVSRWLAPPITEPGGPLDYTSPRTSDVPGAPEYTLREARRAELQKLAQQYGTDPQTLEYRIHLMLNPADQPELEQSFQRALEASAYVHDPAKFPAFVDIEGVPRSKSVDDEYGYRQELKRFAQQNPAGTPLGTHPPAYIRQLRADEQRGTMTRMIALMDYKDATGQPLLADYLRWYGVGSQMSPKEWNDYVAGASKRYAEGTPNQWLINDRVIALHRQSPKDSAALGLMPAYEYALSVQTESDPAIFDYDEINQRSAGVP